MQQLRDYELVAQVGEGGFGEVYRAHHAAIGRDVAIKLIKPEFASRPEFVARFNLEAALIGRLEHPYIVPLYDYWQDDTGAYLVMRWMPGGSLRDSLKRAVPGLEQVDRWLGQIAQALAAAHRAGVVHRDIKPDNILLDNDGNAYLADFGIAKDLAVSATISSQNPITPLYAAPEQFGSDPVMPATDIYSLGITLYEMLVGKPPFEGTLTQIVYAHLHEGVPSVRLIQADLPASIDHVLARATAKLPEDRYIDALSLQDALRQAITRPHIQMAVPPASNPFFNRGPIRDAVHFFDREREVRELLSLVNNGQSVSVIGQRRIGKTSLLYHCLSNDVLTHYGMLPESLLRVYLDCGTLIALDQPGIYRALLEEIADALIEAGIEGVKFVPLTSDSSLTYRDFERSLRQLFRSAGRLVLCMDEFELLSRNAYLESDFFTGLRALAMRYPLTFVTASRQPLLELTYADESTLSSPFFNIFAAIRLGLFSDEVARSLVSDLSRGAGIAFPDELIDRLVALSGGHPLFTQLAGYHAFALWRDDALSDDELQMRYSESALPHLEYYWRSLSPEQQRALLLLPAAQNREPQLVRALEQACLVRRDSGGGLAYLSPVLRDFVFKQQVPGFVQAGDVIIDEARREVICHSALIDLTPTQYDLLAIFLAHSGQVLDNDALERALWGEEVYVEDPERLKSVIKGLRRVLGDHADHIENVRGIGYRWQIAL